MDVSQIIARLESVGLPAGQGYPGVRAGAAAGCVAAVNLTALDTAEGTARWTVTILCPRILGLTACQERAAMAAAALSSGGQRWSFQGWKYDRDSDCFTVELHGSCAVAADGDSWAQQSLQVMLAGEPVAYATEFTAVNAQNRRLIRPHAQAAPCGVTPGRDGWSIRLTRWLPLNEPLPAQPQEPFELQVVRGGQTQVYRECCWSEITQRCLPGGTELVHSGFAVGREVTADG